MDYELAPPTTTALANRLEGRLFVDSGRLCLVLEVDTAAGTARISRRTENGHEVMQVPLSEVGLRLSGHAGAPLDALNAPATVERIFRRDGGWFVYAREGLLGPFNSNAEAKRALQSVMLSNPPVARRA
jgi:hypothetical protein